MRRRSIRICGEVAEVEEEEVPLRDGVAATLMFLVRSRSCRGSVGQVGPVVKPVRAVEQASM